MSEHRRKRMPWKYVCEACGVTWPCRSIQVELIAKLTLEALEGKLVKHSLSTTAEQ